MKTNYNYMTESEKIITILNKYGATSLANAMTTEKLVALGIIEGATKDIFTEHWHGHKQGDHPWWLILGAMCGVGSREEVGKYNVPNLFRQKVNGVKNGRKTKVYVYWFDETKTHAITYTGKAYREEMERKAYIKSLLAKTKDMPSNIEEAEARKSSNPNYIFIDGKYYDKKIWMEKHPEQAAELYA